MFVTETLHYRSIIVFKNSCKEVCGEKPNQVWPLNRGENNRINSHRDGQKVAAGA